MSTLGRKDYYVNLRKSYHFNIHSASETLIFLQNEDEKGANMSDL